MCPRVSALFSAAFEMTAIPCFSPQHPSTGSEHQFRLDRRVGRRRRRLNWEPSRCVLGEWRAISETEIQIKSREWITLSWGGRCAKMPSSLSVSFGPCIRDRGSDISNETIGKYRVKTRRISRPTPIMTQCSRAKGLEREREREWNGILEKKARCKYYTSAKVYLNFKAGANDILDGNGIARLNEGSTLQQQQ